MKVKELIDYLEKCNPEAIVWLEEPFAFEKYDAELQHIVEVGVSNDVIPTVYLY